jgi:hypothetical protein
MFFPANIRWLGTCLQGAEHRNICSMKATTGTEGAAHRDKRPVHYSGALHLTIVSIVIFYK